MFYNNNNYKFYAFLIALITITGLFWLHLHQTSAEQMASSELELTAKVVDSSSLVGPIADRFDYPLNLEEDGWQIPCHNCQYNSRSTRYSTPTKGVYHAAEDWSKWDGTQNLSQNEPVYAAANGIVRYARKANFPGSVVIIEHTLPNGEIWYSLYGHLGSLNVSEGQTIALGNQIGTIANQSDNASHLHFEIRHFYVQPPVNNASYPPANGYWPTRNANTNPYIGERPPDRGWVDPSAFIESHRCIPGGECDRPSDDGVPSPGHFPDVSLKNSFYAYIETLYHIGAMSGYSDGNFYPELEVTRGQIAKIMIEGLGERQDYTDGRQTFSDVPPEHTFYDYIERMVELGITSGYSDGTYRPDENISRGAVAKFMVTARGEEPSYDDNECAFSDVCPAHTFYTYIRYLKEEVACISGYSDGTYRPDNAIRRDEVTKLVVLCLPDLAEQLPPFPDVLHDNTFFSYIKGIHEREIVSGFSDGFYRPDEEVTRGQVAKFIIRGMGQTPSYADGRESFPDVPTSNVFYHYIERLVELEIASGFSDGTYRPDQSITRAEMAKLIVRALGEQTTYNDGRQSFSDVPSNHPFYDDIERLHELNITSGYSDGTYKPDEAINRGAMAKFIALAFIQQAHIASQEPATLSGDNRESAPDYNGAARYVLPSGDEDWIKLVVPSRASSLVSSSYRLSTDYSGPNASVSVEVYDSAGSPLASAGSAANGETSLMWTPAGSGTYYMKLSNSNPYASEGVETYFSVEQVELANKLYLPTILSQSGGLSQSASNLITPTSPDYPPALWVPAHSSNYDSRNGIQIDTIVIHTLQGYYGSSIEYFTTPRGASAHYFIRSSDGEVTQMVSDANRAWHAGHGGTNRRSIGIEHEGFVSDSSWYTQPMYQSSADLVKHLADEYGIPKDRNHIIAHYEVPGCAYSGGGADCHTDPGIYWDWNYFMSLVEGSSEDDWDTEPSNSTGHFSDVEINHTFFAYIEALYAIDAISGFSDGTYRPDENITRAAMAKIIVLSLDEEAEYSDGACAFSDVCPGHPFYHYIRRLKELGITSGYSDGSYRPDESISRGALAKFVVIAHDGSEPTYSDCQQPFPDVSCNDTFYPHIRRLKEIFDAKEVSLGYSDGTFRPNDLITRGQITKLVVIALDLEGYIPTFYDVLYDNNFYHYVEGIAARGITTGCSQEPPLFCNSDLLTRGQIAKFIIRGLGEEPTYSSCVQPFPDVSCDDTFYTYIRRLKELEITTGDSQGNYNPANNITRGEMAKLIIRALGEEPNYTDGRQTFPDVAVGSTFYHYIEHLYELGITSGFSDGTYQPDVHITRDGAAKFIYLAFILRAPYTPQEALDELNNSQQTAPSYETQQAASHHEARNRYTLPTGDEDWIELTVPARTSTSGSSSYRFSAQYSGPNASVCVQVYNSAGSLLAEASSAANGETTLMWTPLTSGTYYVKLTNTELYATEGAYTYFSADTVDSSNNIYLPAILTQSGGLSQKGSTLSPQATRGGCADITE